MQFYLNRVSARLDFWFCQREHILRSYLHTLCLYLSTVSALHFFTLLPTHPHPLVEINAFDVILKLNILLYKIPNRVFNQSFQNISVVEHYNNPEKWHRFHFLFLLDWCYLQAFICFKYTIMCCSISHPKFKFTISNPCRAS